MGHQIEEIALKRGHTIGARIDNYAKDADAAKLTEEHLKDADAVIEFALPGGLQDHAMLCAEHKVPHVIGTTGWENFRDKLLKDVEKAGGSLLYGSNYSVGANVFFALCEKASELINEFEDYDMMMYELHHKLKKDSPSGTALTAAEKIVAKSTRKNRIQTETLHRAIEADEFHVASIRGGNVPGTHTLLLDSEADTIEVSHVARSRKGFALGSVLGAEWMQGKTGIHTIDEYFKEKL